MRYFDENRPVLGRIYSLDTDKRVIPSTNYAEQSRNRKEVLAALAEARKVKKVGTDKLYKYNAVDYRITEPEFHGSVRTVKVTSQTDPEFRGAVTRFAGSKGFGYWPYGMSARYAPDFATAVKRLCRVLEAQLELHKALNVAETEAKNEVDEFLSKLLPADLESGKLNG